MRALFILLCAVCLGGCSVMPKGTERVFYQTSSPRWLGDADIRLAKTEKGVGYLSYPEEVRSQYPAVIILHTSLGVGGLEKEFMHKLNEAGVATLIVDSFTPRGLHKIVDDQTAVSEASILADLFSAHTYLKTQNKIDPENIAVVGFSKGALPALYSSFTSIYARYGYDNDPFRSHLSFYPWCGLELQSWAMGSPVQIHSGGHDVITPASLCAALSDKVKRQNPASPITFFEYEGQRHAFTHPKLGALKLPVSYPYPAHCRIIEQANGSFVEQSSGRIIDADNLSDIINGCSIKGAWVSGDKAARIRAYQRAMVFIQNSFE
ncbi:MAG: dienelactone hydrolase family protein [Alcanivorax sp.]